MGTNRASLAGELAAHASLPTMLSASAMTTTHRLIAVILAERDYPLVPTTEKVTNGHLFRRRVGRIPGHLSLIADIVLQSCLFSRMRHLSWQKVNFRGNSSARKGKPLLRSFKIVGPCRDQSRLGIRIGTSSASPCLLRRQGILVRRCGLS